MFLSVFNERGYGRLSLKNHYATLVYYSPHVYVNNINVTIKI